MSFQRWSVYVDWFNRIGVHVNYPSCAAIHHVECEGADDLAYHHAVDRGIVFG